MGTTVVTPPVRATPNRWSRSRAAAGSGGAWAWPTVLKRFNENVVRTLNPALYRAGRWMPARGRAHIAVYASYSGGPFQTLKVGISALLKPCASGTLPLNPSD